MRFFIKKIIPLALILLVLIFLLTCFLFPKKLTKENIENKITQTVTKIEEVKENIAPEPTKILESGLPNKYLIETAFVQQAPEKNWDQPWQDACEEASLITVDYFYKNNKSITTTENRDAILKMIEFENQQGFTHDINIEQMNLVAQKYLGYQTKIIETPTIEDLKKYLIQNIPIVVTGNGKTLYKENKHFNSGGPYYHSLVILGYDDNKKQFIVHDVGTKSGAYFKYSYSLLMESIHDFPPSGKKEDIDNGPKRVLILLK
ncbi:MAG: C39 family peptidase [Candidatus Shapirobacteria bacterium]|nr:C39 family peptidase [Candidatus Shapirobacteria bacterium]MDD3002935.1 C39 family peptidase [Candidatus Shapirobacteria bacterium]MDD4383379.1 C39 family peptidase [Candidatus Shapirobacteria bacterium]